MHAIATVDTNRRHGRAVFCSLGKTIPRDSCFRDNDYLPNTKSVTVVTIHSIIRVVYLTNITPIHKSNFSIANGTARSASMNARRERSQVDLRQFHTPWPLCITWHPLITLLFFLFLSFLQRFTSPCGVTMLPFSSSNRRWFAGRK